MVTATSGEALLLAGAAVAAIGVPVNGTLGQRWPIVALTAVAMGVRNTTVRRLGAADLTTTVLTLPLAGLAADSSLFARNESASNTTVRDCCSDVRRRAHRRRSGAPPGPGLAAGNRVRNCRNRQCLVSLPSRRDGARSRSGERVADRDGLVATHERGLRGLRLAANSRDSSRGTSSPNSDRSSMRASWAPRQKWMP